MNFKFGKKLLTLLAVSIAFALTGYLILFLCLSGVLSPVISAWSLLRTDEPSADTESGETSSDYVDLYRPSKAPSEPSSDDSSGDEDPSDPGDSSEEPDDDTVLASEITFARLGNKFAEISVDGTTIQHVSMFFGDGKKQLKNGVGMYAGSSYPGMGPTCLVSGHNNRDFHALKDVEIGTFIRVSTSYGEYVYRVTACEVKQATDSSAYDLVAAEENIILYTCYPFNELGLTSKRYFVYGEYVSGPKIILD